MGAQADSQSRIFLQSADELHADVSVAQLDDVHEAHAPLELAPPVPLFALPGAPSSGGGAGVPHAQTSSETEINEHPERNPKTTNFMHVIVVYLSLRYKQIHILLTGDTRGRMSANERRNSERAAMRF